MTHLHINSATALAEGLADLAAAGLNRPEWYGKMAPPMYGRLARTLLSAHVTIASSWRVLWWLPQFYSSLTFRVPTRAPSIPTVEN